MEDKNLKSNFELIKNDYNAYLKTLFSSVPLLNYFYHLPNSLKKVILKILSKNPNFNLEKFKKYEKIVDVIDKIFFAYYNFRILVPIYFVEKMVSSINFQKDYFPKDISKVNIPPELIVDYSVTIDKEQIEETTYEVIMEFLDIMQKNFSEDSLKFFYNNINNLKIANLKADDVNSSSKTVGTYNVKKNEIAILEDDNECTMFHELFHMASSYYDSKAKAEFCGFHQTNPTISIGVGLNEGYTELLTIRFTKKNYSYIYETYIADIIEKIIGKDKMQKLYFSANLFGIIDELSKYEKKDKVIKFIQAIDIYTKYNSINRILPKKKEIIAESIETIEEFLIQIKLKKIKEDIESENRQDYIYLRLENFFSTIDYSKRILSFEKIQNYIKDILEINIPINLITVGAFQTLYEKQTKKELYCDEIVLFKWLTYYCHDEKFYNILNGNFKSITDYLSSFMEKEKIEKFYYAINKSAKIKLDENNKYNKPIEEFILELILKDFNNYLKCYDYDAIKQRIQKIYHLCKFVSKDEFKEKIKEILNITIIINENNDIDIDELGEKLGGGRR